MPTSLSPRRGTKPAAPRRSIWPWVGIAVAAVLAVIVAVLPASLAGRFLPPECHAEDYSGTLWHGSSNKITVYGHDAGALEWRLHPGALLRMTAATDLHWVKVGFVIDGIVDINSRGFDAHDISGGGPLEDLRDLGVAPGTRGHAAVNVSELKGEFKKLERVQGALRVSNLASAQIAMGAELGNYELQFAPQAVGDDGSITAQLNDAGGPLEVKAEIRLAGGERTGILSGTIKERPEASANLRSQLDGLAQLRGRDAQGRIAAELEFTF